MYDSLSKVSSDSPYGNFIEFRDIVVARKQPRKMFVQAYTEIKGKNCELKRGRQIWYNFFPSCQNNFQWFIVTACIHHFFLLLPSSCLWSLSLYLCSTNLSSISTTLLVGNKELTYTYFVPESARIWMVPIATPENHAARIIWLALTTPDLILREFLCIF